MPLVQIKEEYKERMEREILRGEIEQAIDNFNLRGGKTPETDKIFRRIL